MIAPDTLLDPEHFAALQRDIGDLPQLGGNYFDNAFRPAGFDSMRLSCPIVGAEILQAVSARAKNIKTAKDEIENRAREEHDGSLSCPCGRCEHVRCEFLKAVRAPRPDVPPPPFEARTAPPTTLPKGARLGAICEEEVGLSDTAMDIVIPPASIPLGDARWLQAAHAFQPWGDQRLVDQDRSFLNDDNASAKSEAVSHVSEPTVPIASVSDTPLPITDSDVEWDLPSVGGNAYEVVGENPNADYFDIASVASESSWFWSQ